MATSLKDVQESMNGKKNGVEDSSSFTPNVIDESPTQVTERQYVIFKLVKKGQRRLHIDGIGEGINPKTKEVERIWLIRGQNKIWQSDLGDILKEMNSPNSYVSKNRTSLQFVDGICRIPVHDKTKLEYARANIHNVGKNRTGSGKYDYYEYDAAEEQKMRYEKQLSRINLIQSITTMDDERVKKLALFLGIKPYDEETSLPKEPQGFKIELLMKADTQPDVVNKYINAKEVEVSYLVRKGITEGKIDLGGSTGNITWPSNGGHIGKLPAGRKPIEYLTELAMTNSQDGIKFKGQLESIVT